MCQFGLTAVATPFVGLRELQCRPHEGGVAIEDVVGVESSGGDTCVFCSVRDGGDRSNHVLVRRGGTVALLNLAMKTPGHTLVVPDRHVERLDELDAGEVAAVWATVQSVREAIAVALEPDGFVYVQNEGQGYATERHLHVHVLPRYRGDGLRDMWEGERPTPDQDELRRVAALLAPELLQ